MAFPHLPRTTSATTLRTASKTAQPTSVGEVMQHGFEHFLLAGVCRCAAEASLAGRRTVLISQ
jgi:hypothetical protein